MFLKKLFRKDAGALREKGERLLAAGRFADARATLQEALELIERENPGGDATAAVVREMVAMAGNRLAELNIEEADCCMRSGDPAKAEEHLKLSLELAEDVTIREKAGNILASLPVETSPVHEHPGGGGCGGCRGGGGQPSDTAHVSAGDLSDEDRFELLVRPLPGDLSERYLGLGEEFATGYLAADGGDVATARAVYERLLGRGDNDILLYETAILSHREGEIARCESLLRRALVANDANPLSNLGLVQLLAEDGRFDEAIPLLERMVVRSILPEQATMFLGDIHHARGENDRAIERYAQLLSGPLKREAAERLVALLDECGRPEEAAHVAKQHLKGCC